MSLTKGFSTSIFNLLSGYKGVRLSKFILCLVFSADSKLILSILVIAKYLSEAGEETLNLVGVYAIEKEGIKLFKSIGDDTFSIQGLSILPLVQFLWDNKILFRND